MKLLTRLKKALRNLFKPTKETEDWFWFMLLEDDEDLLMTQLDLDNNQ